MYILIESIVRHMVIDFDEIIMILWIYVHLFGLICGYLCRQRQSIQQIGALFLLIMAAVLLSIGEGSSKGSSSGDPEKILFYGIAPVLVASVLSGLASAFCQWASQVRNSLFSCFKTQYCKNEGLPIFFVFLNVFFITGQEALIILDDCRNVYSWKLVLAG